MWYKKTNHFDFKTHYISLKKKILKLKTLNNYWYVKFCKNFFEEKKIIISHIATYDICEPKKRYKF